MDVGTLRQALSVLLVFVLLGLALWKLRQPGSVFRPPWRKPGAKTRSIEAIERLALTPQHMLHLVRVEGRGLIVATHPHGCCFLESGALPLQSGNVPNERQGAGL